MGDSRIVRRLNVIIVLLLGIVGLLSYEVVSVSAPLVVLAVPVLVPLGLLLAAWCLAKLSLAVESP